MFVFSYVYIYIFIHTYIIIIEYGLEAKPSILFIQIVLRAVSRHYYYGYGCGAKLYNMWGELIIMWGERIIINCVGRIYNCTFCGGAILSIIVVGRKYTYNYCRQHFWKL